MLSTSLGPLALILTGWKRGGEEDGSRRRSRRKKRGECVEHMNYSEDTDITGTEA